MGTFGLTTKILLVVLVFAIFIAMWGRPRLAFVIWILSLTMVPVWINISYFASVPAHSVVAMLAIIATFRRANFQMSKFEVYFAVFLIVSFAAVIFGGSPLAPLGSILFRWSIPFFAARVLVSATGTRFAVNVIAIVFGLVGGLAVLELLLSWHPFVGWDNGSFEFDTWHGIQTRAGVDRSEWSFGHSIALGGSLVLAIPFIAQSRYSVVVRVALFLSVCGGIAASGSRGSAIAAGLTTAICLLYVIKQPMFRFVTIMLGVPVVLFALPMAISVLGSWARGDTDEEQGSFDYRDYLYATYVRKIEWFGRSSAYDITNKGQSIDSTFLHIGLVFGWIVLLGLVFPLALAVIKLVSGHASCAEIAIVGQIPLFATVALITQYESMIFVVAGIAAQMAMSEPTLTRSAAAQSISPSTSALEPGMRMSVPRDIRPRA